MKNCCNHSNYDTKCIRISDNKIFDLPRKFNKQMCNNIKGYTMRSSCAPYKDCLNGGKDFLYNPEDPLKSFDVYIDKNPNDTIPIKYTTYHDVINTINKLESLYKNNKYTHKRIKQVAVIMMVRLRFIKSKIKHYKLSVKYNEFLKSRTQADEMERKQMKFTDFY